MQKKKWLPVVLHIMAWTLFFAIPQFMRPEPRMHNHMPPVASMHSVGFWLYMSILQNLLLIPFFYFNTQYIFPKLLPAKKFWLLLLVQVLLVVAQYGYGELLHSIFFSQMHGGPGSGLSIFIHLVVLSVAYGYYLSREAARVEKMQKERENESLKAELQFLRWQVSPHFLFNALNNMVALARKQSDLLEPMIINMSGIMRYMLYETDEAQVSLRKEAEYLESYISLQSMRYDNVKINVTIDIPETSVQTIEPMLLIPFVENAFKHGIDFVTDPAIDINLSITDDKLLFSVSNKFTTGNPQMHDDAHGIGMVNVRKRLTLLYEGRHTLDIQLNDRFTVSLNLLLNKCYTV